MRKGVLIAVGLVVVALVATGAWLLTRSCGCSRGDMAAAHTKAAEAAPESTQVLVTLNLEGFADMVEKELGKVSWLPELNSDSKKELQEYFLKNIGWDPFSATTASLAIGPFDVVVLVPITTPFVPPADADTSKYQDVNMVRIDGGLRICGLGSWLAVGTRDGVEAFIDTAQGRGKSLASAESWKVHTDMLSQLGNGDILLTGDLKPLSGTLQQILPGASVEAAGMVMDFNGSMTVYLKTDAGSRKVLLEKMAEGKKFALEMIEKTYGKKEELPFPIGAPVIWAHHHMEKLLDNLMPKESGDYLTIELNDQAFGAISAASVLSTVAVPAFINYMRKAKTSEAIDVLDKMVKGAAEYVMEPRANRTDWTKLPCQFPETAPPTPAPGNCCAPSVDSDGDGRCDGNPDVWSKPSWAALKFRLDGPHYCTYQFVSRGTGTDSEFEAQANCDLDCDGEMSTFIRYGKAVSGGGQEGAGATECSYSQGSGPYIENETE